MEEKIGRNGSTPIGENDRQTAFFQRLNKSRPAVFAVAEYLHSLGYSVNIPRIRYAPSMDAIPDYQDNGDIIAETPTGGVYRFESKGMRFNFTGPEDWPHKSCIVSNKAAIDRANPLPKAYFIVSNDLQYAAIIYRNTRPSWRVKDLPASNTNKIETFYVCPKEKLLWRKIKGN